MKNNEIKYFQINSKIEKNILGYLSIKFFADYKIFYIVFDTAQEPSFFLKENSSIYIFNGFTMTLRTIETDKAWWITDRIRDFFSTNEDIQFSIIHR